MKKLYILIFSLSFLYGCRSNEALKQVPIKIKIIDRQEDEKNVLINIKKVPLFKKEIVFLSDSTFQNYIYTKKSSNFRSKPLKNAKKLGVTIPNEKIELIGKVSGSAIRNNKIWYKIKLNNKIGYIHSSVAEERKFEFEKMAERVRELERFIEKSKRNNESVERIIAYKPGSKEDEEAPKDIYGSRGEQSVSSYHMNPLEKETMRYMQDGRIVVVKEKTKKETIVQIPDSLRNYSVEPNKTRKINVENGIKKVIVIDLKNQTQGVFLKKDDVWELISYMMITSGKNDEKHAYDTPKGYFIVGNTVKQVIFPYNERMKKEDLTPELEKKINEEKTELETEIYAEKSKKYEEELKKYEEELKNIQILEEEEVGIAKNETSIDDGMDESLVTEEVQKNQEDQVIEEISVLEVPKEPVEYVVVRKFSRANYGIRFSGGGYIHGIPLKDDTVEALGDEEAVKDRKSLSALTLGTKSASHKCVRNAEDYQSFLYDFVGYNPKYKKSWWKLPEENVSVIVF
ncbi:MAG: SH3 domain-containing protein [Psychrilyobacter sp.]|nr:SH3 domain-containing protein [Psychrilyobacter sp.]